MKRKTRYPSFLFTLALLGTALAATALSAACQAQTVEPSHVIEKTIEVEKEVTKIVEKEVEKIVTATPAAYTASGPGSSGDVPVAAVYRASRMIIKNAELRLLVEDTGVGVDRVTQIATDAFGYLVSSRTWYHDGFQYATLTLGIPSDEYENVIRRLRGLAIRVLDENASGTDVSDEYVDLESRLRNLEATEANILTFLDKATTVKESLQVNQELSEITAQIEAIKGRMNYLKNRAAYSTIIVHLEPQLPTPTPTPAATPAAWQPGKTFRHASGALNGILRTIGDVSIWIVVVLGPFAIPAAGIAWLAVRLRRQENKPE
jgi:hypothetical protein